MLRTFAIYATSNKIRKIQSLLDKLNINYSKTALDNYLIVYGQDPTSYLKGFSGVKVMEITGERYLDMLDEKVFYDKVLSDVKEGDVVQIVEGEYADNTGVVEKINKPYALVLLTLWGMPFRTEIPIKCLKKIFSR